MELINDFNHLDNKYSKKINIIKYTEGENVIIEVEGVKDISELIIGDNEIEYSNIENLHRKSYIVNKKLEIADSIQDIEKYSKKFTIKLIQNGLQELNYLSSILYLNEFYKVHCIIYNNDTKKAYHTSLKDYPKIICIYKNNSWFLGDKGVQLKLDEDYNINDLSNILTIDCELMIFKPYLCPISKYKLKDLEDICNEINIPLKDSNNKKKLKKELYNEINIQKIKNS